MNFKIKEVIDGIERYIQEKKVNHLILEKLLEIYESKGRFDNSKITYYKAMKNILEHGKEIKNGKYCKDQKIGNIGKTLMSIIDDVLKENGKWEDLSNDDDVGVVEVSPLRKDDVPNNTFESRRAGKSVPKPESGSPEIKILNVFAKYCLNGERIRISKIEKRSKLGNSFIRTWNSIIIKKYLIIGKLISEYEQTGEYSLTEKGIAFMKENDISGNTKNTLSKKKKSEVPTTSVSVTSERKSKKIILPPPNILPGNFKIIRSQNNQNNLKSENLKIFSRYHLRNLTGNKRQRREREEKSRTVKRRKLNNTVKFDMKIRMKVLYATFINPAGDPVDGKSDALVKKNENEGDWLSFRVLLSLCLIKNDDAVLSRADKKTRNILNLKETLQKAEINREDFNKFEAFEYCEFDVSPQRTNILGWANTWTGNPPPDTSREFKKIMDSHFNDEVITYSFSRDV